MLVNQVQGNSLDVVFRSDQHTTAQGLRLDTTCFQPSAERGGATGEVRHRPSAERGGATGEVRHPGRVGRLPVLLTLVAASEL